MSPASSTSQPSVQAAAKKKPSKVRPKGEAAAANAGGTAGSDNSGAGGDGGTGQDGGNRGTGLVGIRRRDVHALLDGLVSKGKTGTASDVRKHLSRLFNWAIDREIIAENPLTGLKRKDLQYRADASS